MKAGRKRAEQQLPPDWEDWEAGQPYEERSYSVILSDDGQMETPQQVAERMEYEERERELESFRVEGGLRAEPADDRVLSAGPFAGEIGAPDPKKEARSRRFMDLRQGDVRHGIVMAEILGPPRSQTI